MPDSDDGAAVKHPYTEKMDSETAALFDRMPSDTDLRYEIKLLRTRLAMLTDDLKGNIRLIVQIMQAIIRATQVRIKQGGGKSRLGELVHQTAPQVRKEKGGTE